MFWFGEDVLSKFGECGYDKSESDENEFAESDENGFDEIEFPESDEHEFSE
jgi:hypothetical protein